jgi:hypothetical protein
MKWTIKDLQYGLFFIGMLSAIYGLITIDIIMLIVGCTLTLIASLIKDNIIKI